MTGTAQSILIADAVSRGMFEVPLMTFLGIRNDFPGGQNNSHELTLKELLNVAVGGSGAIHPGSFPDGLPGVLKRNLSQNWMAMSAAAVFIPIGFKIGTKLLRKPVIQPANRLLKMAGLGTEVKV